MAIVSDSLLARSHIRSNLEGNGDKQGDIGSVSNSSKVKVACLEKEIYSISDILCLVFPS